MPTQASTVTVRSRCMTRWRWALWHDGSSRGAARALILRKSISSSSQDMSSTATTRVIQWLRPMPQSWREWMAYLMRHPSLKHHPSPLGHGWELVGVRCALSATRDLLSRRTYLHQGQLKRAGKMTARRRMRERWCTEEGGFIWIWWFRIWWSRMLWFGLITILDVTLIHQLQCRNNV